MISKDITDRIIRSATLENMADEDGCIDIEKLSDLYNQISAKTIITGFVYVSNNGRAMQKRQAGLVNEEHQKAWSELVRRVKLNNPEKRLFMQLAHAGRQTTRENAVGVSTKRCSYFRNKVRALSESEIKDIISDFASSAKMAQEAGFDGVQIHAAHGYLIHQFLSKYTNTRKDCYQDGDLFLVQVLEAVKKVCGNDFQLWVKISAEDDRGLSLERTLRTIKRIENLITNVEVSYGTMEYALNIIRGAFPINLIFRVNPLFSKYPRFLKFFLKSFLKLRYERMFQPFTENYNLENAKIIKQSTSVPVTVVGGIRDLVDIEEILKCGIDFVSMSRPFICEPELISKIKKGVWKRSICSNCNLCTIYCDSENSVRCYGKV